MSNPYRIGVLSICFLIVVMDGYDTQAIGLVAAAISRDLGIALPQVGWLFSSGLLGSAAGACLLGPLGDHLGRKRMLLCAMLLFAVCTLATPWCTTFSGLLACRLCAGLGLGGAIPNVLAMAAEYTPLPRRGLVTGLLFAGFPCGGFLGAMTAARMVPTAGWQAVFYIGGAVPLLLAAIAQRVLPGSRPLPIRIPAIAGMPAAPRAALLLASLSAWRGATRGGSAGRDTGISLGRVVCALGLPTTILLWASSILCFVILIDVGLWTPVLLSARGIDAVHAVIVSGLFNLGSAVGTAAGGRALDRFPARAVLPACFLAGACAIAGLARAGASVAGLYSAAMPAGACIGAASAGVLALAVDVYPAPIRASGVGWVIGMGRAGQVLGPLAVGALIGHGLPVQMVFLTIALPALCGALSARLLSCGEAVSHSAAGSAVPGLADRR
jgi:AAHS family 4-hydroxybenzoate transporter-like MFS transporter